MTDQPDEAKSFDELLDEAESDEPDDVGNLTVFPDEPPSSGEWVDTDDALANLTDEEIEEGRRLGLEIDIDDDDDTGVEDDG